MSEVFIISDESPKAVCREDLLRTKGKCPRQANRSGDPPPVSDEESLRDVLQDGKAVAVRQLHDGTHVTDPTVPVNYNGKTSGKGLSFPRMGCPPSIARILASCIEPSPSRLSRRRYLEMSLLDDLQCLT